jgi:phage portal protein BeeE
MEGAFLISQNRRWSSLNILSKIFKSRDKPKNSLGHYFFGGSSSSGKMVTERSSMQMTAVYSCVRILAEAVAGLPFHLYRYNDSGGKEKALGPSAIFFASR